MEQDAPAELRRLAACMRELRPLCDALVSRVEALADFLAPQQDGEGYDPLAVTAVDVDAAVQAMARTTSDLRTLMAYQAARATAVRLADAGRVRRLRELNERVDAAFRSARAEHLDGGRDWARDWPDQLETLEQRMLMAARAPETVLGELQGADEQREALAVVKHALLHPAKTLQDHDELLRVLFRRLVQVARVPVPALPAWFVSPGDLTVHSLQPVAGGAAVQVLAAMWAKPDGQFAPVLLKRVAPDWETKKEAVVAHEAALLHTVRHANVLRVLGGCHVGADPFVVLECPAAGVEGVVALDEYLGVSVDHRRLTLRLLAQAARGLQVLHETHGVAHGDLRCANVFVGDDHCAKLGNLASFTTRAIKDSTTNSTDGKELTRDRRRQQSNALRWQPPELLKLQEGDDDRTCDCELAGDIYSLGMCLIEALAGDVPWGLLDDEEVRVKVLAGELAAAAGDAKLDEPIWSLIEAMCDADAANRPDIATVVGELDALADEEQARDGGKAGSAADLASTMRIIPRRQSDAIDGALPPHPPRRRSSSPFPVSPSSRSTISAMPRDDASLDGTGDGSDMSNGIPLIGGEPSVMSHVVLQQKWLGVKINSVGNRILVSKFLRSESGAMGELEASGSVALGDEIAAVNGQPVRGLDRQQLGSLVASLPRPIRLTMRRDPRLLGDSFRFHGLRVDERWRDRGSALPLPSSLDRVLGSDSFALELWFSLADVKEHFLGGILLGAQDTPVRDGNSWPYTHRPLLLVDPIGTLWCAVLGNAAAPLVVATDLVPGHWYHLVLSYTRDGHAPTGHQLAVYLDGEQRIAGNGPLLAEWSRLRYAQVGSGCISGLSPAKPSPDFAGWFGFSGLVFDLRVWHAPLSDVHSRLLFRGGADLVDQPFYSLRREFGRNARSRRDSSASNASTTPSALVLAEIVRASRPHQVVAQVYN